MYRFDAKWKFERKNGFSGIGKVSGRQKNFHDLVCVWVK